MTKPTKFVGLHAHDGRSAYDGFGGGDEHIQFAADNGMDAMAISNHGNINSYPECEQKARELNKIGRPMKFIAGCEFYYHPDLKEWAETKASRDQLRKDERDAAKKQPRKSDEDDDDPGVSVEDEDASKRNKFLDPVNRRHHLVVLPKSRKGLENIFRLVSRSNREGYYRFPRIDARMLKEHGEDLIISTACVSGAALIETNYGVMSLRELVERLKTGFEMSVLSYDEIEQRVCWQQVLAGDLTRHAAPVVKIKTKSGKTVTLTRDHRVLTNEGWLEAGDLIPGKHRVLTL
jgi:DNA polymerase III alpha subunit (gram-positive type)